MGSSLFLDNEVLLITGGTGSFGNAVLRRFLQTGIGEIRILSRDEKTQVPSCESHPMEGVKANCAQAGWDMLGRACVRTSCA